MIESPCPDIGISTQPVEDSVRALDGYRIELIGRG
jgi:hypothetical protein